MPTPNDLFDSTTLERIADPQFLDALLIRVYNRHRQAGSSPALASAFSTRLEKLLVSLRQQGRHARQPRLIYELLYQDFEGRSYFDDTLRELRLWLQAPSAPACRNEAEPTRPRPNLRLV